MNLPLLESARALADKHDLLPPGSLILVAVSGGQDSCALLHALAALREERDITLHVAHLNHGFRGEAADGDAEFVRVLAESLHIGAAVEKQDVPGMAERLRLSNQEAARRARNAFLDRAADDLGACRIALGHTRDDRVETVLMNILRGTGVDGLAGLAPRSGRKVRPLLGVSREETAGYCRMQGIAFRDDASNLSFAYTRNRVREELLPLLESYYHPGARNALLRLADLAEQDSAVLNELANESLIRALLNRSADSIVLSSEVLSGMPRALQRRVIRSAIAEVRGGLHNVDSSAIEKAVEAVEAGGRPRFQFTLPKGDISIEVSGSALRIARAGSASMMRRFEYSIDGFSIDAPGSIHIPELGARFEAGVDPAPANPGGDRRNLRIRVDRAALRMPITIRNRRPGDRIRPLGLGGTRKVQDILVDGKVPADERDAVPIVADPEGILWVAGHAADERTRITAETRSAIYIEMIRDAES